MDILDIDQVPEEGKPYVARDLAPVAAPLVASCRLCGAPMSNGRLDYCSTCLPDLFAG